MNTYNIFLWADPSLLKVFWLIELSSKFMQEKQQKSYFCYILLFQFALIKNQPNARFLISLSIGVMFPQILFAIRDVSLNICVLMCGLFKYITSLTFFQGLSSTLFYLVHSWVVCPNTELKTLLQYKYPKMLLNNKKT